MYGTVQHNVAMCVTCSMPCTLYIWWDSSCIDQLSTELVAECFSVRQRVAPSKAVRRNVFPSCYDECSQYGVSARAPVYMVSGIDPSCISYQTHIIRSVLV